MSDFHRSDWDALVAAFTEFFRDAGTVTITDEAAAFAGVGTGFELARDGTSRSFMPLHELGGRWERVQFDEAAREVRIRGNAMEYVYRVPGGGRRR